MTTRVHACTSAALGGVIYAITNSWQEAAAALITGVFIDIDHIFDFLIFSGERLTMRNFTSWCGEMKWNRITLIFHSYELFIVLGFIAYYSGSETVTGILYGAVLHVLLDQTGNLRKYQFSQWFYFLAYRIIKGFKKDNLRSFKL
ncbi:hypothetical protein [Candidatus Magnetominusculus dajiuhuensis]|uniref:hypothetical protein n=1 Tax=Candidatus Magnetominusculus dajiuhuensis TaxID=3137712 RepID=UPI003B42BA5B